MGKSPAQSRYQTNKYQRSNKKKIVQQKISTRIAKISKSMIKKSEPCVLLSRNYRSQKDKYQLHMKWKKPANNQIYISQKRKEHVGNLAIGTLNQQYSKLTKLIT